MKASVVAPNIALQSAFLILITITTCTSAANILFFFGMSTYSHRITAWPLAVKLAEQGHTVTFLQNSVNKNPHPKVIEMVPKGMEHPLPPNFVDLRLQYGRLLIYALTYMLPQLGTKMCFQFLNNSGNIEWVNRQKFDLVIIDALFNDCAYGLAWKWKAKTIVFGTSHVFDWFPDNFGFPDESATAPGVHFADDLPLGFFGRVHSQLSYLYMYFNKEFRGVAPLNEPLREKLNMPEMPPVSDLIKNTSLILLNTHFSEELPRSLPPFVVPVGGMHVSEQVKPLPKELEDFISGSGNNGFIYVSFGSEADFGDSSSHIREIFFNAIANSKTRFLWKWNGERPKEMPKNVLSASWMPQQDVLGHPKIRGFITHGGLLGGQEAVAHAVPMIVVPIFAEQDYNAERLQRTGRGIRLDLGTITQAQLEDAINRLLTDASLKEQMKLASIRFKDRPQKPVETAVWWVNYVMRHEDTSFLKPLAISRTWYQRRQLDVWCFLLVISLVFVYLFGKICAKIFHCCCSQSKTKGNSVTPLKKKNQ